MGSGEVGLEGVGDGLGGVEATEAEGAVDAHQDALRGRASVRRFDWPFFRRITAGRT